MPISRLLIVDDEPANLAALRHHHEKWDGSGYPLGLSGAASPEWVRIVAIADVFDALTMKRPYKEAWPVAKAVAGLRPGARPPCRSVLDRRIRSLPAAHFGYQSNVGPTRSGWGCHSHCGSKHEI